MSLQDGMAAQETNLKAQNTVSNECLSLMPL